MKLFRSACLLVWCLVAVPCAAQVAISATPSTIIAGQSSTIACSATVTGPGPGSQTLMIPSFVATPTVTTPYTCSIGGATASTTVTVNPAPPPPASQWVNRCAITGDYTSTCGNVPAGRGFSWKLPFDSYNGEFLLFMGEAQNTTIYSTSIWGYSARTKAITLRVSQTLAAGDYYGGRDATKNPIIGHPQGNQVFDNYRNQWYSQGVLAGGYNAGFTSRYDALTQTMLPVLPKWSYSTPPYSPMCDGNFNCGYVGWDSGMEFIAGYGKTIICCNGGGYNIHVVEFDGTNYEDVSSQQVGADGLVCYNPTTGATSPQCPNPSWAALRGMVTDGFSLYVFGGAAGSNFEYRYNDLYKYEPVPRRWTKLTPSGGIKPPSTYAAGPMMFFDSNRSRIVYIAGTNDVWQYSLLTNAWTQFAVAGNGPVLDSWHQIYVGGKSCGFDAEADIAVCVDNHSQNTAPNIWELRFSGS